MIMYHPIWIPAWREELNCKRETGKCGPSQCCSCNKSRPLLNASCAFSFTVLNLLLSLSSGMNNSQTPKNYYILWRQLGSVALDLWERTIPTCAFLLSICGPRLLWKNFSLTWVTDTNSLMCYIIWSIQFSQSLTGRAFVKPLANDLNRCITCG